jgi:hypothetical protein
MRDKWLPISMLAVALALYASRHGGLFQYSQGTADAIMAVIALVLVGVLLWPSKKTNDRDQ